MLLFFKNLVARRVTFRAFVFSRASFSFILVGDLGEKIKACYLVFNGLSYWSERRF